MSKRRTPEQLLAHAQRLRAKATDLQRKRDTRIKIVLGVGFLATWKSAVWTPNSRVAFANQMEKCLSSDDWDLIRPLLAVGAQQAAVESPLMADTDDLP